MKKFFAIALVALTIPAFATTTTNTENTTPQEVNTTVTLQQNTPGTVTPATTDKEAENTNTTLQPPAPLEEMALVTTPTTQRSAYATLMQEMLEKKTELNIEALRNEFFKIVRRPQTEEKTNETQTEKK